MPMKSPIPARFLALAGAAVAVHVARKVLRGSSGESRHRSRPRPESTPKSSAVVHAFQSTSLSPSLSEAGSPTTDPTSSSAALNSGLVMLLATLLLIAAAGVAALRAQWDLAGAVAGAWLLVLLSQVGSSRLEWVRHLLLYGCATAQLACCFLGSMFSACWTQPGTAPCSMCCLCAAYNRRPQCIPRTPASLTELASSCSSTCGASGIFLLHTTATAHSAVVSCCLKQCCIIAGLAAPACLFQACVR